MQKTKNKAKKKKRNRILRGICQVVVTIHQYKLSAVFTVLPKPKKHQVMYKEAWINHFCQVGLSEQRVNPNAPNPSTSEWENKENNLQTAMCWVTTLWQCSFLIQILSPHTHLPSKKKKIQRPDRSKTFHLQRNYLVSRKKSSKQKLICLTGHGSVYICPFFSLSW